MANKKVLIVDNDTNICELLRLYLEKDGFDTVIANDGEAAIVKFNVEEPDIISRLLCCLARRVAGMQNHQKEFNSADNNAYRQR